MRTITTETMSKSSLTLPMRRPTVFRVLHLMLLLAVSACGASIDPGSDSTTHFWITCSTDAECSGDNTCICGRCTEHCTSDAQCSARNVECMAATSALSCDLGELVCAPTNFRVEATVSGDVDASTPAESDADSGSAVSLTDDSSVGNETERERSEAGGASLIPQGANDDTTTSTSADTAPNDDSAQPAAPETNAEQASPSETQASSLPFPLSAYASMSTAWSTWTGSPGVPSDCRPMSTLSDDQLCQIQWTCDDNDYLVSCMANEPDEWECLGYWDIDVDLLRTNYLTLRLQSSNSESACLAASSAYMSPRADQQCVVNYRSPETVDEGYACQWEEECSTQVNSTTLTMAGSRHGRCFAAGDDYVCQCDGVGMNRSYIIAALDDKDACALARATCETDETPTNWIEADCTSDSTPFTGNESCRLERTCPITAPVSERVSAFSLLRDEVSCDDDGNVRACRCEGDLGSMNWSEAPQVDSESCNDALDVCERAGDITFPGVPECTAYFNDETDRTCSRKWQCRATGMLNQRELEFTEVVEVSCEDDPAGESWLCTCNAGTSETTAVVEDSLGGSDACDQEFTQCQAKLNFLRQARPTAP